MNIRNLISDKLKNKSELIKNAIHDVNDAPGAWQTLDFLNPSYAVIDFADGSLDTLSIEWYVDWVKLQIAYLIAADIVEDIDEELGFDFDASEYSEKVMRMTLKEVKKIMPSYSTIQKYYKEFLKEVKECCPDEFDENKENISVKSFRKLYEANKYFFGTENPSEVKKLFESTSSGKKSFTAIFLKEFNKNKESIIKSTILDALNAPSDMCIEDLMDDFKPRAKRFSLQWYSEWLKRYAVWYLLDNSPDSPYSGLDGDLYDWFSWGLSALKNVWEITQEIENGYEEFIQQR